MVNESRALAALSLEFLTKKQTKKAIALAWLALPHDADMKERPVTSEAWSALIAAFAPPKELGTYNSITEKKAFPHYVLTLHFRPQVFTP